MGAAVPYRRILFGTVAPVVIFALSRKAGILLEGAMAASFWSLAVMAFILWRDRHWDVFSITGAAYAMAELVAILATRNPEMFLLGPIVFAVVFGLFFFASWLIRRPALLFFAEQSVGRETFDEELRNSPCFMVPWNRLTLLWGTAYLGKATALFILFTFAPEDIYLGTKALIGWPMTAGLVALSFWYPKRYWDTVSPAD